MNTPQVIVVDDEEHLRTTAAQTFDLAGIACACFADGTDALNQISRDFAGVIVTDIRMPGLDGTEVLRKAMETDPDLPVILVTGHGDVNFAVACMKEGAYDFIEKPFRPDRLVACVKHALEKRELTLENRMLHKQMAGNGRPIQSRLVGKSPAITAVQNQLQAVAATDVDVLITGASGTGKEVAARALHAASERSRGPFVHINCAALPEALVESELFGHEAGAYPGATRARHGKFEHARRGILCLDEIDSLAPNLQAKLLHALQNRQITRLGSNDPIDLDLRVVAISKRDLAQEVQDGRFRTDLFYLLNVAQLHLPALSERREDIPRLFAVLVAESAARYERPTPTISHAVLQMLAARDWPGNVRELKNMADRFVLDLEMQLTPPLSTVPTDLASTMAAHEKAVIAAAISIHDGRLRPTYEALGISRKTLYEKMQRHGLARDDFADQD
ncbi:MAG: sigma-54 dependent transcriptional regulator [Pseudomonadota bacterium]